MITKPTYSPTTRWVAFIACISCLFAALSNVALAAPPDLTDGGVPTNSQTINLGATGLRGWVYFTNGIVRADTSESRQIQVKSVATGSPADGILMVDDVILGADGTGAEPVNFTSDARKSLAYAIADAEASTPATLKLRVWRSGATSTMTLTLRTMGAYSDTAPYNCPKSAKILEEGLSYIMSSETSGRYSFGTMSLLAANNPSDPNNAARMARAQTEARALIPDAAAITRMMASASDTTATGWERGHTLIFLSEYYLLTGDTQVLPAIRAYAVNIANGQSLFGTLGHLYADPWPDGSLNGPMGGGYGVVNSAAVPCFLGLVLAKQCGITDPEIDPGIERASRFFAYYVNKGAIPYGEHEPGFDWHESNGKSGLAALAFGLQPNRLAEAKFFARMSTASTSEREEGHTGSFFNYLWAPLAAASAGEQAAAAHFSQIRWMLDLSRKWDGSFDYDCLNGQGPKSGEPYFEFRMSTAALLTYALPLRQLYVTGRGGQNSAILMTPAEVSDTVVADNYNATSRSVSELISDLGNWSPKVQKKAAVELSTRTLDSTDIDQIISLATDPNGTSRPGACLALGRASDPASAATRAATLAGLLTDPQNHVRYMAAEGMRYLSTADKMAHLNTILSAAVTTAEPLMPFNEEDPLHMAHGRLSMLLFYGGTAFGPTGVLAANRVTLAPKNLLYPAIKAVAGNPIGICRGNLASIYPYLTRDDLNAVADAVVDVIRERAPADRMFSGGARTGGLQTLQKFNIAEGVPLSLAVIDDDGSIADTTLAVLKKYAGSSNTVVPDPDVDAFCLDLISRGANAAEAQAVLDAIAADTNPAPLTPFKTIQSITADHPALTLPAKTTMLRTTANDFALGDSIYTWRKLHGAGNVTFTPTGTADSKNTTVLFDGTPGEYLFEVKMSDSRGLTEITSTVAVTLYQADGTLPPNGPPVATSQSPTVVRATPTPIFLTGTDPEGLPLNFSVVTHPAHGSLTGTAPNLIYTSDQTYTGSDSFTFQVQDSEGQTSVGTVFINVTAGNIPTAVYEPFDYPVGTLNGASGASEVGFDGPWSAEVNSNVVASSLAFGSLPTLGGSIGNVGAARYGGKRAISPSALTATGLLNDGSTLWFSVVMGYGSAANATNARLTLALANSNFSLSASQYYILDEGPQLGSGLGVTLGRFSGINGKTVATHFRDASFGTTGWDGNVFGTVPQSIIGNGQQRLVVGKITWGAASDTIELYEPYADMTLGPVRSTLTVNVDQSSFDTITWSRSDVITMDEIRFGPNYDSVLAGNVPMTADTTPPTPATMAFLQPPAVASPNSISMTAVTAFDPNGVEYYFTCTAGGGNDSGWQASPSYTDTGLTPGVAYSYTVMARDISPAQNQTAASPAASATISTQTPVPPVIGMIQSAAESTITSAGLVVGNVTSANDPNTFAGTILAQTPVSETVVALGTAVDIVVSLGPLPDANPPTITPADFVDNQGGAAVIPNTPVTYALTFSEDIDAFTVSSADFGNAGSSAITIGSVAETSQGVFTVQVTPTTPGTLRLRINAGAIIMDMSGNALNTASAIADDTSLAVDPLPNTGPVIYEPFDMTAGTLKDRPAGFGLSVNWARIASSDINEFIVSSPGMTYGTLPVVGNRIKNNATGGTRANNALAGPQLANRGLLIDGATLWFSLLVQPVATSNTSAGFALASGNLGSNNSNANVNGIGIFLNGGDDLQYCAWKPGVTGTYLGVNAQTNLASNPHLVVGKIVWGIDGSNDTFELFMPDEDLNLGSRKGSIQSIDIDQTTINRIVTFNSGGGIEFDEIRVGPSYESVIGGGNAAPVWASNPFSLTDATEDSAYGNTLTASVSDEPGTMLVFSKLSGPAWLTVASNGTLSGTPTNSDLGSNSFTLSVTDGLTPPVEATLDLNVLNTNDVPVWSANPIIGADATEDSAYSGSLVGIATDVDPATVLTYAKVSGPSWLSVASNGDYSGTPTNDNVGINNIIVSVSDGIAPAISATLRINVINTNDTPVWTANPVLGTDGLEDSAYSGSLAGIATDVDPGASLAYAKVSGPAWLTVAANGTLSGTPANGDVGLNAITVSVTDGIISTPVETTLHITVINTNDAPVWTADPIAGADATEDSAYSSSLADTATDVDLGASLTYAKVSGPAWLSIALNGALSGTPANGDVGPNAFTVSVSDGIAAPVLATLNITVINTNDAPTWTANPITGAKAAMGLAYSSTLAGVASDVDSEAVLTYAKVGGPAWLVVAADGTLSGTPTPGDVGDNAFTVSVTDGIFATPVEATLNITVSLSWFWDGGNADIATDGEGASGGTSGTWNGSLLNWDVGTSPHVAWNNSASNIAVFGGTAGTVTAASSTSVGGMLFLTNNYTITGGSLVLAPSVTFTTAVTTSTVNSTISGTNSTLIKAGTGTLALGGSNTFDGPVQITGGTLSINAMANGGVASPLGQSSSAASNLLLGNGTTLTYTGTIAASSDRSFTINGTAAGHGATLSTSKNTQGAALNLTSTAPIAYGAPNQTRTLTLSGANNLANTHVLAAQITDNGTGKVTLSKTGTGSVWHVTNPNNSFTGGVKFNRGFLVFSSGALGSTGQIYIDSNAQPPFGLRWAPGNTDDISSRFNFPGAGSAGQCTLDTGANDVVFANEIAMRGGSWLIKEGSGSLTLNTASGWGNDANTATLINAGTLVANVMADGEVKSSIGNTPNTALAFGLRGGALRYIGAGATTDRNFHMSGNNTIDASGTGALVFSQTAVISPTPLSRNFNLTLNSKATGNAPSSSADLVPGMSVSGTGIPVGTKIVSIGLSGALTFDQKATATATGVTLNFGSYAAGTLTLTGSNTGENEIKGILRDSVSNIDSSTATLSIAKTGAGQWVLSGANTYTGATTVSGGTLALIGGSTASPITVTGGASLRFALGSPAVTSTSSVNLAGGTVKITGTPTLDSYTLMTANGGFTGTPVLDTPIGGGYELAVDGTELKLIKINYAPAWTSNPVNEAAADEDAAYTSALAAHVSDINGDVLTFVKLTGPSWLDVAADGTLSGTPGNSDVGTNEFTVSVSDNIAAPMEATLLITVVNTNDAPVWLADPLNGPDATEDTTFTMNLAANATDVDPDASLFFAKVSGPAWLNIGLDGTVSGIPANEHVGTNSFIVSVTDGIAEPVETTLNIVVINTNDAPVFANNPINGAMATEDAPYSASIAGSASDVDAGAILAYAKVSGPAWLTVAANGALTGTPTNSNVGSNVFTVSVSDGIASPVEATLIIVAENTNDAPVWTTAPIDGADAFKDVVYTGSIASFSSDDDGDSLTYAKVSGPAWLTVAEDGTLAGTPAEGDLGPNLFTVSVSDSIAAPVEATLNITVSIPLTPYEQWTSDNNLSGSNALPAANPDNDLLTNLQEYAFGTNPTISTGTSITYTLNGSVTSPGTPMAVNMLEGQPGVDYRAVFGRRKNYEAAGLTYTVKFSADMINWFNSNATPTVLTGTPSDGDIEAVSVPYPFFIPVVGGYKKPTFFSVGVSSN